MLFHSDSGQADVVGVFNTALGYFDDLLGVGSPCFAQMVGPMCPTKLQLNRAGLLGAAAPFLDLGLYVVVGMVSAKICDRRDDFNVPRSPSYGVYNSQLIHFARVCSHVNDFNNSNKELLTVLVLLAYFSDTQNAAFELLM